MKLVIFDVDGTLVDSQAHIMASMQAAFHAVALPTPPREDVLSIVGLSLPLAMDALVQDLSPAVRDVMVETYKDTFAEVRMRQGAAASPMFPGADAAVQTLAARDDVYLAIATGKSRRGLDALMTDWAFADAFVTTQVADDHPSKPHPSMIETCLMETGVAAKDAVIVGDTTYDIEMAKAAGIAAIGVTWGYHGAQSLFETGATVVIGDFAELSEALNTLWAEQA